MPHRPFTAAELAKLIEKLLASGDLFPPLLSRLSQPSGASTFVANGQSSDPAPDANRLKFSTMIIPTPPRDPTQRKSKYGKETSTRIIVG